MALAVATPDNLNEFAKKLGLTLNGGGGSSDFVYISGYLKKDADRTHHFYIAVDSSVNMNGVTLRYCRKGRVHTRKGMTYHQEDTDTTRRVTGWHQVWRLPISDKQPLIELIFKSTSEPAMTIGNTSYYEVTVDGWDTLSEYLETEPSSGYSDGDGDDISIPYIMRSKGGVCLIKNGKQRSNFTRLFAASEDGSYHVMI